jgi:RimJ/RimL family protein N-acetyltransferase
VPTIPSDTSMNFAASYLCLRSPIHSAGEYEICSIRDRDILSVKEWRNAQLNILRQEKLLTDEEQEGYFRQYIFPSFSQAEPGQILFSLLKNGEAIGYGGLVHLAWKDKRAEVSFLVAPERAADPSIYRADFLAYLGLVKKVAFDDLGFNRIFTETFDIRDHHISILEESGFRLEGTMKEHVIIDGRPVDSLIHGFLKSYANV